MTYSQNEQRVPLLLWPFWLLWRLVRGIFELTGRLLGIILGFVLVVAGIVLSLAIVGAIIGVPLAGLGILLIIRGLF